MGLFIRLVNEKNASPDQVFCLAGMSSPMLLRFTLSVFRSAFGDSLEARRGWMMPIGFRRSKVKVTFNFLYLIFLSSEAIGDVDDSSFGSVRLVLSDRLDDMAPGGGRSCTTVNATLLWVG